MYNNTTYPSMASMASLAPLLYVGAWTAVPLLDKVALRTVTERAMLWATFLLGAAMTTVALAALAAASGSNAEGGLRLAVREARAALAQPVVWLIGAATVAGYLAYFAMLSRMDVHKVLLLNPLVLCASLLSAVLILGERIHGSQALGVGIVLCGLVAFYWHDLSSVALGPRAKP